MPEADKLFVRSKFCEMRERGNLDGPRPRRPFPNTHDLPFGVQLSKPYATELKARLTSDASATGHVQRRSLNSMTWSPHLRRVHLMPGMLRDTMVWLGPVASAT